MKDPFLATIMYAIEHTIHEADAKAQSRGLRLTDSNIRSLYVKGSNVFSGKPKPILPSDAGAKELFLAEVLDQLIDLQDAVAEETRGPDGSVHENPIRPADWVMAYQACKSSCSIHTRKEPGLRGYLDFLHGFIAKAGKRR